MIGSGRTVGSGLMIGSAVLLLAFLAWLITALRANETTGGGLAIGIVLACAVLFPVFGIGAYLFRRGNAESTDFAMLQQQKKLLNMILTQGQLTVAEAALALNLPRDTIEEMIRDLVGKQLFSGAINWEKGVLYSVESQSLTASRQCPNCGGELSFAGKGLIVCPYCGSEIFLTKRTVAQTT